MREVPETRVEVPLVLGWRISKDLHPQYWLEPGPGPGRQTPEDLVRVPPSRMACHMGILAQSGAGKSFLLGRMIEELLLETRARCVVFDSNGDFLRVHEVKPETLWTECQYDSRTGLGRLPHEARRESFERRWRRVSTRIRTMRDEMEAPYERLRIPWTSISPDFLAEELEPKWRSELHLCHRFVQLIAQIGHDVPSGVQPLTRRLHPGRGLLDVAEELLRHGRNLNEQERIQLIQSHPRLRGAFDDAQRAASGEDTSIVGRLYRNSKVVRLAEEAVRALRHVSPDVERFYLNVARERGDSGFIDTELGAGQDHSLPEGRLDVIDLASLPDRRSRLMAVNALLRWEWHQSTRRWEKALKGPAEGDRRAPTFIVVDEAHILVPSAPRSRTEEAIREEFRTIAAEGRKFGMFLVLATQRPDKVDPYVLSEFENMAVMRIGASAVRRAVESLPALDGVPPRLLEKCVEFGPGRALLAGRWVEGEPRFMYCAARRTVEGGRDLRADWWATMPQEAPEAVA
ncbi:MAG: ATP-binding protein [Deltaproteobacteria bacterium]|nr:ATP-binding protein [Deltaproteobacteria bacterium]